MLCAPMVRRGAPGREHLHFPRLGGLWRHADFLRLWTGQTISQFGSQITLLALPLTAVLLLKASPLEMGILNAIEMAPFLIIGLPAGVWVDRLPRRPVLILGDFGRALALATIPAAYLLGLLTMAQLYAVAAVTGTLTVFFDVAYMSYLPALVNREQLVEGNSKMEVTRAAAQIAGPGMAGTLVDLLAAPLAIALDAVSFVVSSVFVLFVRATEPRVAADGPRANMRAEMGEGLRWVLGNPLLRAIAGCTASSNFFSNGVYAMYVLFAVRELGLTPGEIGFIFAVGNLGFLAGAFLAAPLARTLGLGRAIVGSQILGIMGWILVPLAMPETATVLLIASGVIMGLTTPVYNINQVSLRQAITPDRLQGRMNATMRFMVWGTMPLGSLLGGALGQALGLRPALWLMCIGGSLPFLWVLLSPVRSLREQPAPAEA